MELPHQGFVRLVFDIAIGQWCVVHLLSGERVLLPASGDNQWRISFENGDALLANSATSVWLGDMLEFSVVASDAGELFLVDSSERPIPLHDRIKQHTKHTLRFNIERRDQDLDLYIFERSQCGARVWHSLKSIWAVLALETPMRERQWREAWWPWWTKLLERLGLACPPHLRRAAPQRASTASEELYFGHVRTRLLGEPTMSTAAVLVVATKASCTAVTNDAISKARNKAAWLASFTKTFLTPAAPHRFTFFLDTTVVCDGSLPVFGDNPVELSVQDAMVDVSPLASAGILGGRLHGMLGHSASASAVDILVKLFSAGRAAVWAFKQFVYVFASIAEATVLHRLRDSAAPMDIENVALGRGVGTSADKAGL